MKHIQGKNNKTMRKMQYKTKKHGKHKKQENMKEN